MSIRAFNRVLVAIVPLALMLLLSLSAEIAQGQVDTFEFDTPEQQQRFRRLSDEFRCPMCQNTSLSQAKYTCRTGKQKMKYNTAPA